MLFSGYNLGVHLLNSTTHGIALDRKKTIKENGDLRVVELDLENSNATTRNSVFIIDGWWFLKNTLNSEKQKIVVKQPKTRESNHLSSSLNEKQIYDILLGYSLADYVGEFITFDKYFHLLYFSFSEEPSAERFFDTPPLIDDLNKVLVKLANTVSRVHGIEYNTLNKNGLLNNFGFRKPLLFGSTTRSLADGLLENPSLVKKKTVELLFQNNYALFDSIRAIGWQEDGLIHYDLKLDHILCNDDGEKMRIIDWEMGDVGDRHWDIACLWYEYIHIFINSDIDDTIAKSVVAFNTFLSNYSYQLNNTKLVKMLGVVFLHNYYYGLFPKPEKTSNPDQWIEKAVNFVITGNIQNQIISTPNGKPITTASYKAPAQNVSVPSQQAIREGRTTIDPVLNDLIEKINANPDFSATITTSPTKSKLSEFIYEWFFGKYDSGASTIPVSKLNIGESPAVGTEKNYNDHWWQVEGITAKERVVVRKVSEKRFIYAGDFIYSKNSRTQFGEIPTQDRAFVTLNFPNYSLRKNDANDTSTDLWIFSKIKIRQDYPNWVRFYFHLNENVDAIYTFIQEMSRRLNEREIPFEIKLRNAKSSYYRNDVAILYIHRQHFAASIDTIAIVYAMLKRDEYLRNSTPKFTKIFKDAKFKTFGGLAFGENPSILTESFGNWRAKIIAEILVNNWAKRANWLAIIKTNLAALGFNIHEMYRNPFDEATEYKFPYHLLINKLQNPPLFGINIENALSIKPSRRYLDAAKKIAFIICREAIWYGTSCTWIGFKIKEEENWIGFEVLNACEIDGIGLFLSGMAMLCPSEDIFKQTALGASKESSHFEDSEKLYEHFLDELKKCSNTNGTDQTNSQGTILNTYQIDFSQELYTSRILADNIISKYIERNLPFPNAYASGWDDDLGSEFNPTLLHGLAGLGYFFLDIYDRTEDNLITNRGGIQNLFKGFGVVHL